jgi:hypothetical protein
MHINISHILIAIGAGVIGSLALRKSGKVNLKMALAVSALVALVIFIVDWIRL